MKPTALYGLALLLLTPLFARAQEDEISLKTSGQIRGRGEVDDRDFNEDTDASDFSMLRARLNLKSQLSDRISAFVQLQDSRVGGSEATTLSSSANVDLHQGYFQIDRLFWDWLSIKQGRMELSYGTQRLLGAVGWHNVGRAFDAQVLGFDFESLHIDLIGATLDEKGENDEDFGGVYLSAKKSPTWLLKPQIFQLYLLSDVDNEEIGGNAVRQRGTVGFYGKWKPGKLDVEAEFAVQGGEFDESTDIAATMLTGSVAYNFGGAKKARLALGLDLLSGDDPETEDYEAFHTLFATNHKFYGYMDYFINIPRDTRNLGLSDLMLKGSISPWQKTTFKADLHVFGLAEEDPVLEASDLGAEIDLTFVYKYAERVSYTAGVSVFGPGDVFEAWRGEDGSAWAYSQIVVNY